MYVLEFLNVSEAEENVYYVESNEDLAQTIKVHLKQGEILINLIEVKED